MTRAKQFPDPVAQSSMAEVRGTMADRVSATGPVRFRGELVGRVRGRGPLRWVTLMEADLSIEVEIPSRLCPAGLRAGSQLEIVAKPDFSTWRKNPVWVVKDTFSSCGGHEGLRCLPGLGPKALERQQVIREFSLPASPKRSLRSLNPSRSFGNVIVLCGGASQVLPDLCRGLEESGQHKRVRVRPIETGVQGKDALDRMVEQLRILRNRDADLVVIIRGGGSYADFATLDDRKLVAAIKQCEIPVVTAVGHDEHVPSAALAADANFAVPYAVGEAIGRENKRRAFAGLPSYAELRDENKQLRAHAARDGERLEQQIAEFQHLRETLEETESVAGQLRAQSRALEALSAGLGIGLQSCMLDGAVDRVQKNSLSAGLWWCLWTLLMAVSAFTSPSLNLWLASLFTALPAAWAILTLTGGWRAASYVSGWRIVDVGALERADTLSKQFAQVQAPRHLRRLVRASNDSHKTRVSWTGSDSDPGHH